MSTVTTVTETLPKVLTSVYSSGAFPKIPNNNNNDDNKYRFYHCIVKQNNLQCTQVNKYNSFPIEENTRLMFINKLIPETFDKYLLKYEYAFSLRVEINK
jgi:hypothetical protein